MVEWDRPLQKAMNELWVQISQESGNIEDIINKSWKTLMREAKYIFENKMLTTSYKNILEIS